MPGYPQDGKDRPSHRQPTMGELETAKDRAEPGPMAKETDAFDGKTPAEWVNSRVVHRDPAAAAYFDVPGYEVVGAILQSAYDQTAKGKGRERHANDKPFRDQPIMEIGRMSGVGGHVYQIMKKAQEAQTMHVRDGKTDAAIAEFRGVIVYAVAAILLLEEAKSANLVGEK